MNLVSRNTLERLREATFLSDEEWSDCLQLSQTSYKQLLRHEEIPLSDQILEDFSSLIDATPEAVISGCLDFKTIAKRQKGFAAYLPERYFVGAHSKVRTSSHLLDYIETHYGWRFRSQILRHFQLNESVFADLDRKISIHFLSDLCGRLTKSGFQLSDFHEIGKYSVVSNSNSPIGRTLSQLKTPELAYETLFAGMVEKYYDQNFAYRLSRLEGSIGILEARPSPPVVDELDGELPGSQATCASRSGTCASIMNYLGAPDAKVIETTCIHRGDPLCTYVIDFQEAQAYLKTAHTA